MANRNRCFRHLTLGLLAGAAFCLPILSAHAVDLAPSLSNIETASGGQQTSDSPIATGARSFIDKMAGQAIAFLADKSMSEDQKRAQFSTMLMKDFDMETIGRFALGTYWNQTSPQQRQDYLHNFSQMIVRVYSIRFENYNGQKFETRGARQDSDTDTLVSSAIIPANTGDPEVQVDWRVRYKNGQYKVVDVVVEGVSMAVTQRSDFSSVIQQNGGQVEALLAQVRAEADGQAPAQQQRRAQ